MASAISSAAPSPCTRHGARMISRPGFRRCTTCSTSRIAAPVGDVTRPMRCGYFGSGRFRSGANKPFRRELLLEFLKRDLQRADALQFHRADDELVLPARLINRHVALQQNLLAVRQQFAMRNFLAAEQHAAQLRRRVLEREINVAGRLRAQVGDFAAHPDGADLFFQQRAGSAPSIPRRTKPCASVPSETVRRSPIVIWICSSNSKSIKPRPPRRSKRRRAPRICTIEVKAYSGLRAPAVIRQKINHHRRHDHRQPAPKQRPRCAGRVRAQMANQPPVPR